MNPRIYVASKTRHAPMWKRLRDKAGFPIISTWIDEAEPGQTKSLTELWNRIHNEVFSSTGLIFYAEPEDVGTLKGAYIEAGMALAHDYPVTIWIPGIELEDDNDRPIGSWIRHPAVKDIVSVYDYNRVFASLKVIK